LDCVWIEIYIFFFQELQHQSKTHTWRNQTNKQTKKKTKIQKHKCYKLVGSASLPNADPDIVQWLFFYCGSGLSLSALPTISHIRSMNWPHCQLLQCSNCVVHTCIKRWLCVVNVCGLSCGTPLFQIWANEYAALTGFWTLVLLNCSVSPPVLIKSFT